jgi:hypothetical protein
MNLVPVSKTAIRSFGVACILVCSLLIAASSSYASDFVFIRSAKTPSLELQQLKTATDFYGLNLVVVTANSPDDSSEIEKAVHQKETLGVAVAADALAAVNRSALLHSLQRPKGDNLSLLILGQGQEVDPVLLQSWTGGAVSGVRHLEKPVHPRYVFGRISGFTGQLADLVAPASVEDASFLVLGQNASTERILNLQDDRQISPLFIETTVDQHKLFIASSGSSIGPGDQADIVNAFLRIAPELMFVKYCAGERGWHTLHHYANFTIDDPWLRQPYGYVDYKGLLEEMQRHNFHTTIAFIPWNYQRSQPEVVSIFRNHPDRFSITVHGNNHDHKEFTDYRSKPLPEQVGDLKQALARMEQFRASTGIDYDWVMVFPHSIGPEDTLAALKTYNYWATVNSSNVPQAAVKSTDPAFDLRPVTLSYAGFASFSRYPVGVPLTNGLLAVNDFLGNPLFFYTHSNLFSQGINAFDTTADEVNKLEPHTEWRSLGDIVRHSYLLKLRDDGNYDALAFSNAICLENTSSRDLTFYLQKQETGPQVISSVTVDGQPHAYQVKDGHLYLSVDVPKGARREVTIQYHNDLMLASIDPSHDSYVVSALRMGSDFRDIYLSKSKMGLAVVHIYDKYHLTPMQILGSFLLALVICASISIAFARKRLRGAKAHVMISETSLAGKQVDLHTSEKGLPTSVRRGRYVLLTSAYNEQDNIERTINSVLSQTLLPKKWVIISDGSEDQTDAIVKTYAKNNDLILFLRVSRPRGHSFGSKVLALREATKLLEEETFDFIGNIDADVSVDPSYFAALIAQFEMRPKLGLAGGFVYEESEGRFQNRNSNRIYSVAHAAQLMRRECYDAIGGYAVLKYGGEDWHAQTSVRMKGWSAEAFPELEIRHHKKADENNRVLRRRFSQGRMDYSLGSKLFFEIVKCAQRTAEKPLIVGGVARLTGFLWSAVCRDPKPVPEEFVAFLRREQSQKLGSVFRGLRVR